MKDMRDVWNNMLGSHGCPLNSSGLLTLLGQDPVASHVSIPSTNHISLTVISSLDFHGLISNYSLLPLIRMWAKINILLYLYTSLFIGKIWQIYRKDWYWKMWELWEKLVFPMWLQACFWLILWESKQGSPSAFSEATDINHLRIRILP